MERHKCRSSTCCTNSKFLILCIAFFVFGGGGWVRDCIFRICCVYKTSDIIFTFFLDIQVGIYLPCYDIFRNWFEELASQNVPTLTPYAPLVAGALARSLACATCYPIELARTRMQVILNFGIFIL